MLTGACCQYAGVGIASWAAQRPAGQVHAYMEALNTLPAVILCLLHVEVYAVCVYNSTEFTFDQ